MPRLFDSAEETNGDTRRKSQARLTGKFFYNPVIFFTEFLTLNVVYAGYKFNFFSREGQIFSGGRILIFFQEIVKY